MGLFEQRLQDAGVFDLFSGITNISDINISDINEILEIIDKIQPQINMRLTGPGYSQSVSYNLNIALIELQKIIHKTYALSIYGSTNLKKLTSSDKEMLEVFFKVGLGSSTIEGGISNAIKTIAGRAVDKMNGGQILAIAIIAILVFGGAGAYEKYIDLKKQEVEDKERERRFKHDSKQQEIIYEAMKANERSQEGLLETIRDIASKDPIVAEIYHLNTEEVPDAILKVTSSTESTEFNGHIVTGEDARLLNKKNHDTYLPFKEDWAVKILGVNTTLDEGGDTIPSDWKINAYSPEHDRNFTITITAPNLLNKTQKDILWSSIEDSKDIIISINGKRSSDWLVYKDLTLLDIKP